LGDGMTAPPPSQPKASPPWTPMSRGAAPWPATEDLQPIPSIASSLYTAHRRLAQSPPPERRWRRPEGRNRPDRRRRTGFAPFPHVATVARGKIEGSRELAPC
jgi:hypothetical protein